MRRLKIKTNNIHNIGAVEGMCRVQWLGVTFWLVMVKNTIIIAKGRVKRLQLLRISSPGTLTGALPLRHFCPKTA